MSATKRRERHLSLSEKYSRLCTRLRDPEWRRYGGTLLGGKLLGVGVVLLFMLVVSGVFFTSVHAQSGTPESIGHRESREHDVDSRCGFPGVRDASRLHHA